MRLSEAGGWALWLGGVFDRTVMMRRPGVNPAARSWQSGLIRALQRRGVEVRALGHVPEPLWPRGAARVGADAALEPAVDGEVLAYYNLPGIRPVSLERAYRRGFERTLRRHGAPAVILSYNAYPYNLAVGLYAQRVHGIPWVPIVADVPEPGRTRDYHDRAVAAAAGRVFLSWASFRAADHASSLHLDGGLDVLPPAATGDLGEDAGRQIGRNPTAVPEPAIIAYTGSLGRWGGVSLLLEAFRGLERRDVELWICGKGDGRAVARAAREDPRIRFLGLVPEERLHEVRSRASVLVNPRPPSIPGNAGNFPSKILEYLSYGKPVLSTWTPGLAPGYREVLTVVDEAGPQAFRRRLEEVLGWDAAERRAYASRAARFLRGNKLWDVQAERLLTWLEEAVLPRGVGA